jgi:N-acetylneuraminate lyase
MTTTPPIIRGILPALVTPMNDDGTAVNLATLPPLLDFLLERGVHGFFVCGGTGEGLLLDINERQAMLETVTAHVSGRASIIAHIGALATQDAQKMARHAVSLGVDAIAAVPPVYFRVDQKSIIDHYRLIAEAANGAPVHVYNIPSATGVEINAAIMTELLAIPNVSGIKYSAYNLYDMHKITQLDPRLTVLSGFDEVCVAGLSMGAHGAIGSTYNVMPATFSALYQAAITGNWEQARALQVRANLVIQALISVPMVAGLKAILTEWGFDCGVSRRPQRPLTAEEHKRLFDAINSAGLEALEEDALAMIRETAV